MAKPSVSLDQFDRDIEAKLAEKGPIEYPASVSRLLTKHLELNHNLRTSMFDSLKRLEEKGRVKRTVTSRKRRGAIPASRMVRYEKS